MLCAESINYINCHKAVLYVVGDIEYDELIADPRSCLNIEERTYRLRALEFNPTPFARVATQKDLNDLLNKDVIPGHLYVGQIFDENDDALAHSFLIGCLIDHKSRFNYVVFEKSGFISKFYNIIEINGLMSNNNYSNKSWRFFQIRGNNT